MQKETLDPGKQTVSLIMLFGSSINHVRAEIIKSLFTFEPPIHTNKSRAFNMNEFVDGKAQQPLPPILEQNEEKLDHFISSCRNICLKILELFAIGLKIDQSSGGASWFLPQHDPKAGQSGSVFRLLYYPKVPLDTPASENDARCGAHSDYGTITLLFQRAGQDGLEILTDASTDSWSSVPVNPTNEKEIPILVNVGDLLSFWTNNALKSAVHRVTLPDPSTAQERYSIAYFCHPLDTARLEPVPSKMVQDFGADKKGNTLAGTGKILTAKQHLESRLSATYT
jgi:isopenicillin N synthase-like dioxygenase